MSSDDDPERRLDRVGIAARLTTRFGRPVSPRTVAELPIPYKVVMKKATSTLADVDAYADATIARSALRIGGRQRPLAPADEEV